MSAPDRSGVRVSVASSPVQLPDAQADDHLTGYTSTVLDNYPEMGNQTSYQRHYFYDKSKYCWPCGHYNRRSRMLITLFLITSFNISILLIHIVDIVNFNRGIQMSKALEAERRYASMQKQKSASIFGIAKNTTLLGSNNFTSASSSASGTIKINKKITDTAESLREEYHAISILENQWFNGLHGMIGIFVYSLIVILLIMTTWFVYGIDYLTDFNHQRPKAKKASSGVRSQQATDTTLVPHFDETIAYTTRVRDNF